MADLRFQERVEYGKKTTVDLYFVSSRCVSSNIAAQFPFFLPQTQLQSLAHTHGGVGGLTTTDFSLEFPDFASEWTSTTSNGIVTWRFQGGPLRLKGLINIYVDERAKGRPEVLDVIMEHEFLHVADEIEVLRTDLPARLRQDTMLQKYLIDKKPVDDSMFQNWFKSSKFQEYVQPTWTEEHNKRARKRDSGMEYARYINSVSGRL